MPLYHGKKNNPNGMPDELMEAAEATDDLIGDELAGLIPPFERPIGTRVMDSLAKAVADASALMGMELEVEKYTEPTEELDADLVRILSMLGAAAEDYGSPLPPPDSLRSEQDITRLTAAIIELSKDDGFAEFLDMGADEDGEAPETGEDEDEDDEDEDFDFASRM